jgi:hypothetical protein
MSVKDEKCIGLSGFKVQKCIPKKPYSEKNGGVLEYGPDPQNIYG